MAEARTRCKRCCAGGAGGTLECGAARGAEASGGRGTAAWTGRWSWWGRHRAKGNRGTNGESQTRERYSCPGLRLRCYHFTVTETRALLPDLKDATAKDVLALTRSFNVRFLRLQFTDIVGVNKNVEIPSSQFEKALAGDIMFDGSSIEGFVRIEESDMLLAPDLTTFRIFPWGDPEQRVARMICDINLPNGEPFPGDPRGALKRVIADAARMGYTMNAGMEAEFFMFKRGLNGENTTQTHDIGGYFDLAPVDLGEEARRAIVQDLELMGFEVEAAHHEVAHGQHEIDFRYADALTTPDNIAPFRFVVKVVAQRFGLAASFMPKPIFGQNGSGMHTPPSRLNAKNNAFWDKNAHW